MNKNIKFVLLLFWFLFFIGISSADNFLKIKNIESLIGKVLKNHPDIQIMKIEKEKIKSDEKSAFRIPNPELNTRLLYGLYSNTINGEYSLKQPIELGGKRGARIKKAQTRLEIFNKKSIIKKQNIVKEVILMVFRLRQIKKEKEIIGETHSTYSSILRKMRKLPRLKPELIISRDVYLLAIEESKEKIVHLDSELIKILARLELYSGVELKDVDLFLPGVISNWPKVKKEININSPILTVALFEKRAAKLQFDLIESEVWPDLLVGPVFSHEGSNSNSFAGGVAFSVTVPIFYRNGGELESAKKNIELSKLRISNLKKRLSLIRKVYLDQYNLYKAQFKRAGKKKKRRHRRLHSFLNRGMVSASLVIEYHRQELDVQEWNHRSELETLKSLWSIYSIDGTVLREVNYEK